MDRSDNYNRQGGGYNQGGDRGYGGGNNYGGDRGYQGGQQRQGGYNQDRGGYGGGRDGGQGGYNKPRYEGGQGGYNNPERSGGYGGDRGGYGGRGGYQDRGGRGGYQDRGGRGGGRGGFGDRPQAVARTGASTVDVITNQYILKLGSSVSVFQYALDVQPMAFWDAHRVQAVVRFKRRAIEAALGQFVCSGKCIYTLQELTETVAFPVTYKGQAMTITIDVETMTKVTMGGKDTEAGGFSNEDHTVTQSILNIIIKQAFRDTNLKQIGRSPRFFDVQNPTELPRQGLQIWSGFKASAFQSQLGCTLVIDNIFKFMSTKTCLQRINEIADQSKNKHHFEQCVKLEFCGKSIIANWGNKRTYIVTDVEFDQDPISKTFQFKDEEICVADYFKSHYGMVIQQLKQPLFLIKIGDQHNYLPPEFCLIDGVPDSIRASGGMRDALAHTRVTPQEKMDKIFSMCKELFEQKAMKDWDLSIEKAPVSMETKVMAPPQMLKGNQVVHVSDAVLRKLPIQKAVDLTKGNWILVYQHTEKGRSNFRAADKVYNTLVDSCKQLQIRVEEPHWVEMGYEDNREDLEYYLRQFMMGSKDGIFRHPIMVVAVLGQEHNYKMYKEVFGNYRMPSQVVTVRNALSFNASKASNILRQVNSKVGGDLFNLKFPTALDDKRTMLIGIDVCHAGDNSVVGFSASTNPELSQYYSDFLIQRKGQEIVEDKMKDSIKRAIEVFAQHHEKKLPTNFIIFRDGVGDAMRDQVLQNEIPQFQEAINELYGKDDTPPEMTVIVVNKRISQRFFVQERGQLFNPPSGCIIDTGLVESDGSGNDKKFDFYMTPASANQGCVLPTHFFVPKNDSSLTKVDIQQLTYSLCHFYFNWAGPIKVPAPCQYAHKIAEFYMNIGANRKQKKPENPPNKEEQTARDEVASKVQALNEKLHFL